MSENNGVQPLVEFGGKIFTAKAINTSLQKIAYRVARESYQLTDSDFRIRWFQWQRSKFRTRRMGSAIAVYFGVFPLDKDFLFHLHSALRSVRRELDGKPAIEVASKLREMHESLRDANWAALPKIPPRGEFEVEEVYRVVVRHRKTGLVAIKESSKPVFSKLVLDARLELAEFIAAIEAAEGSKLP
jgi:hypothetical protein